MLTKRFSDGVLFASQVHAKQLRKGSQTPYVSHPLAVASLVLEFGGDEDQALGGLLHDVIEDGGAKHIPYIRDTFGERVLSFVLDCTDGEPDSTGKKEPWKLRKERYLSHLTHIADDSLIISASDKLHNARSILDDLLNPAVGLSVFSRFRASKAETLWYYNELSRVFVERNCVAAPRLAMIVSQVSELAAE